MWSSLKLRPPSAPSNLIPRPRIDSLLDQAVSHPLTVVSAGAGSGKTSAAASWAHTQRIDRHVAWLGLDRRDNKAHAFWSGLSIALIAGDRVSTDSALRDFAPASVIGPGEVASLLARLIDLPRPVVLVLDDFHHISSPEVLEGFEQLADHGARNLRLVLLTRVEPPLRLRRLRLGGALAELTANDLAFTLDESAQLLELGGLELRPEQVATLRERTKGWAAGLHMAATLIDPSDIDAGIAGLTGSREAISDYLLSEVLDHLEPSQREFLLQTSITRLVNSALANWLSGRRDSQLVLERLVSENALVSMVDDRREWFSYHPLLRDLLRHRLTVESPDVAPRVHLRASDWLAANDQPVEAIRHAVSAGDWTRAGDLMFQTIPTVLSVAAPEYAAAINPLARRASTHPGYHTLVAAAACHMQQREFAAMERDTVEARQFLCDVPAAERASAEVVLDLFVALGARIRGNTDRAVEGMSRVLDVVDGTPRSRMPLARHYRAVAASNLGAGLVWSADRADAERVLADAELQLADLGLDLPMLNVTAHRALLDAMAGRLRKADRRATSALELIDRRAWGSEYQALGIYLALGLVHLGRGQYGKAGRMIRRGLSATGQLTDRAVRLVLAITAVQVSVAKGDTAAAAAADDRLRAGIDRTPGAPLRIPRWAAVAGAQALISAGRPQEAVRLISEPGEDRGFAGAWERVCLAHGYLELSELGRAEALLRPMSSESGWQDLEPLVMAELLHAAISSLLHRDGLALKFFTAAVRRAQPEQIRRPFLLLDGHLRSTVHRYRLLDGEHSAFVESVAPGEPASRPHGGDPGPLEHLTEREQAVLDYLPTMLKANEIAADLHVSVNTVKAHLRSLYRKLDAGTRREAVERARARGLL